MTDSAHTTPGTRAAVAAGAIFTDEQGRLMLVRPTYKDYWDVPGGYVGPGETPSEACAREVVEELGITPTLGRLLAVDWAPLPEDGDKVLFLFDGGQLPAEQLAQIQFRDGELAEYRFVPAAELPELTLPRLVRRLTEAPTAHYQRHPVYLEHGTAPSHARTA